MRHQNSKKLFTYWNNLRGKRIAPDRREIEPSDIRDILGETFILELDQKYKNLSFRLAGTRLCNIYGRELKGIGFLSLWDEKDNMKVFKCVRGVFLDAKPSVVTYIGETEGKKEIRYEMLLLPLLNGPEHASRILGVASPLENHFWIGSDPIINNRLRFTREIGNNQATDAPSLAPALDQVGSLENDSSKKFKHLTVIDGGIG
ncbi:MAG: PAS domain-containing protein [Rhizobiaceae bacterium]